MTQHLYPGAVYLPVGSMRTDPVLDRVAGVIWHVTASEAESLAGYFDGPSGGVESHFHVPKLPRHPVEQFRPCNREADANYRGNSWWEDGLRWGFLSIEFQGADVQAGLWTPHQLAVGLSITEWAQRTYEFPRRVARHYHDRGVGYHVMFGAGPGTESWSNKAGKICPGPSRIRQFHTTVVPAFLGTSLSPAKPPVPGPLEYDVLPDTRRSSKPSKWARKVQCCLLAHGHRFTTEQGKPNSIDGFFGAFTEDRLKVHQAAHGLPPTGVCDLLTWRTLIER